MEVILVDDNDKEIGRLEKIKAHREGKLHRAFSVFIFNSKKELLIQKRSFSKYHSPGKWSNTCCSHPENELINDAKERLNQELGIEAELKVAFSFIYRAEVDKGMIEHEYDHVIIGKFNGSPIPNLKEVSNTRWTNIEKLEKDIQAHPEQYTPWLKIAIPKLKEYLNSHGLP